MKGSDFKLKNLLEVLDEIAPPGVSESWDNVGMMLGNPTQPVTGVLIGLDPTPELLDEALSQACNTIITHHPLIFHPLRFIRTDDAFGLMFKKALAADLAIIGCHTNLDVVEGGVNDVLAKTLGVIDGRVLEPTGGGNDAIGFGRIGKLDKVSGGKEFVAKICQLLGVDFVRVAGKIPETISTVAVCGGSGSDLAPLAHAQGAEIYITGEVKHSTARWAEDAGFCLVDAGHFATENVVVAGFAARLGKMLKDRGAMIKVSASVRQKSPFRFVGNR